jgi:hypothetical protein
MAESFHSPFSAFQSASSNHSDFYYQPTERAATDRQTDRPTDQTPLSISQHFFSILFVAFYGLYSWLTSAFSCPAGRALLLQLLQGMPCSQSVLTFGPVCFKCCFNCVQKTRHKKMLDLNFTCPSTLAFASLWNPFCSRAKKTEHCKPTGDGSHTSYAAATRLETKNMYYMRERKKCVRKEGRKERRKDGGRKSY